MCGFSSGSSRTFEKFLSHRVVRTVIGKLLKTARMKVKVTFQQLMSTVKIGLRTIQKVSRSSTVTKHVINCENCDGIFTPENPCWTLNTEKGYRLGALLLTFDVIGFESMCTRQGSLPHEGYLELLCWFDSQVLYSLSLVELNISEEEKTMKQVFTKN